MTTAKQDKKRGPRKKAANLSELEKERDALEKKIREARANVAKEQRAKARERHEIAGAVACAIIDDPATKDGPLAQELIAILTRKLTRAADRELLGLPPLPASERPPKAKTKTESET